MYTKVSFIFSLFLIYSVQSAVTNTPKYVTDCNPMFKISDGGLECDICQWLVGKAEGYLLSNQTESLIEQEVDKLCKMLSFDTVCESLVHTYLPEVLNLLEQHENPLTVCEQIHFCPTEEKLKFYNNQELCNYIVFLAEKLHEFNEPETKIRKQLYNACELLPKLYFTSCEDFVSNEYTTFSRFLEEKLSTQSICMSI